MSRSTSIPQIPRLWLIGGTSESVMLANQMECRQIPVVVTVTTESACNNYSQASHLWVQSIRFVSDEGLAQWLRDSHIMGILDASHPFATEISARAIRVGKDLNLAYLRFERASVTTLQADQVTEIDHISGVLSEQCLQGQRVLLTLGSQALERFASWHRYAELYARVLPNETAIKLASQAGFRRDRLIALQPPLSFELECALWQHWNISLVITKASGHAGGEDIKRQVAEALKIKLFVIKRPQVEYPWKTQSITTAVHFGRQVTTLASKAP